MKKQLALSSLSSVDRAPPGVRELMGSILVGDSDFFFFPRSCHVDQFTFHISFHHLYPLWHLTFFPTRSYHPCLAFVPTRPRPFAMTLVSVARKAAKYEIQKPSTCRATLFRCKFSSMFPVFHLA